MYLQTNGMNIFNAYKMVMQTTNTLISQSRDFEIILNATGNFVN